MSFRPNIFTRSILSAPAVASRKVFDLDVALLQVVTGGYEDTDRKRLQTRCNELVKLKVLAKVRDGIGARIGKRAALYRLVGSVDLSAKSRKKRVWQAVTGKRRMRRTK